MRSDGLRYVIKTMSIGDVRPREDEDEDGTSISITVTPSTSISNDQGQPIVQDSSNNDSQVQDQADSTTSPSTSTQEPIVPQGFIMFLQTITPWIKSWVILVRVSKLDLALLHFVNIILLYFLLNLTV